MANQKKDQLENKRKTLKALVGSASAVAGASALPEKWSKPIVSSIVLPAHAVSSGCVPLEFGVNSPLISGGDVTVEMVASDPITSEAPVQVEINYFFEGGSESDTFETQSELAELLEGQTFEVTSISEVSDVNSVEALFDYCDEPQDVEWD